MTLNERIYQGALAQGDDLSGVEATQSVVPVCRHTLRALYVMLSVFTISSFSFTAIADTCTPIMIQDEEARCACSAVELAHLETQLTQSPEIESPQELQMLIRTFLCGKNARATSSLRRHMPKLIATSTYGTGDEKATLGWIARHTVSPLAGHAYNPYIGTVYLGVELNYSPNAVCVASARFIHKTYGWLLVGISDACD